MSLITTGPAFVLESMLICMCVIMKPVCICVMCSYLCAGVDVTRREMMCEMKSLELS